MSGSQPFAFRFTGLHPFGIALEVANLLQPGLQTCRSGLVAPAVPPEETSTTARLNRMDLAISAADVRAAAGRIRPLARKTPVMTSAGFDERAGARTFFKCENLQRGGAFKIRGAANLIPSLGAETPERGVVAY